ncbi:MAG TPA: hypothetical protein VNW25_07475 [Candidatus Sulfotelmatobacter sp.]|nr:hypothetical protein [Candidatus Sulfotelmatobacter sp.]
MVAAVGASIVLVQVPSGNVEYVAYDGYGVALWAVGVLPGMAWNVSNVDVSYCKE